MNRAKSSVFDRVMNATAGSSGTSKMAAAALARFGVGKSEVATETPGEEPLRDEDGALSVDLAETMLKWHAECVGRLVELSSSNDVCVHLRASIRPCGLTEL